MKQYLVTVATSLDDLPVALFTSEEFATALAKDIDALEGEHYAVDHIKKLWNLYNASYICTKVTEFGDGGAPIRTEVFVKEDK